MLANEIPDIKFRGQETRFTALFIISNSYSFTINTENYVSMIIITYGPMPLKRVVMDMDVLWFFANIFSLSYSNVPQVCRGLIKRETHSFVFWLHCCASHGSFGKLTSLFFSFWHKPYFCASEEGVGAQSGRCDKGSEL